MFLVPRPEQFDPPINLLPELLPYYPVYGALSHWFSAGGQAGMRPAARRLGSDQTGGVAGIAGGNRPSAIAGEAKRYRRRWIPCADD